VNTSALRAAYRDLLAAAEKISETAPLPEQARADADWTLAHVALSDRLLAAVARDVLAGHPSRVDNRSAMDAASIAKLTATTSHAQRIDLVRRNADDLLTVIETTPNEAASTPVELHLVDRNGQETATSRLTWAEFVSLRATRHLPGHAARLASYAGTSEPPEHSA
jgi:hypothetical protein